MIYKDNIITMDWMACTHGENFATRRKNLTPDGMGFMPKFGVSLYRLDPGKRCSPAHYHTANDEAILILDGTGCLRVGESRIPLAQGDYVHIPAGSGQGHQVINDGNDILDYLCFSSRIFPEVSIYPESGKIGVFTNADDSGTRKMAAFFRNQPIGYWDGEK